MTPTIRKHYFRGTLGDIHIRSIDAVQAAGNPPLVCLHPAPSSGLYFATVMPMLNLKRQIVAPDYPGYGGSYPVNEAPAIADYAAALLECLPKSNTQEPIDLLGFHTGCLVAAEMSLLAPKRIGRIIMIDAPFFDRETQEKLLPQMAQALPLGPELDCLAKAWDFNIAKRIADVPLPRAFELFVENLRAGTSDHLAFAAAFSYDCAARFAAVMHDVQVLATRSGLLEPSHAAAAALPNAVLCDVLDVSTAVFESSADAISTHILNALADD